MYACWNAYVWRFEAAFNKCLIINAYLSIKLHNQCMLFSYCVYYIIISIYLQSIVNWEVLIYLKIALFILCFYISIILALLLSEMFSIGSFISQMVIHLFLLPKTFLILYKMVLSAYFSNLCNVLLYQLF